MEDYEISLESFDPISIVMMTDNIAQSMMENCTSQEIALFEAQLENDYDPNYSNIDVDDVSDSLDPIDQDIADDIDVNFHNDDEIGELIDMVDNGL